MIQTKLSQYLVVGPKKKLSFLSLSYKPRENPKFKATGGGGKTSSFFLLSLTVISFSLL
jgi:hypothetical protein